MTEQDIPLLLAHQAIQNITIQSVSTTPIASNPILAKKKGLPSSEKESLKKGWILLINGHPLGSVRKKVRLFSSLDTVAHLIETLHLPAATLCCQTQPIVEYQTV